jgi:hypothetical protein
MGVGPQLLVGLLLIKVVPPFMAAATRSRTLPLSGIIEGKDRAAFIRVVAFEADPLSGSQERKRAKSGAVGRDRQGATRQSVPRA